MGGARARADAPTTRLAADRAWEVPVDYLGDRAAGGSVAFRTDS